MDLYWDEPEAFGLRRRRGGTSCLTGADWSKGRAPTGTAYGYRWVQDRPDNRTKEEWPYSYSEHYLVGTARKGDSAVYSDRLSQWDRVSFSRAWDRTGSYTQSLSKASDFMTTYFNRPMTVTAVAEGCNVSSGYPYWIIWYREGDAR